MDEKKKAAAIAAVMAYVKEEEALACALAMQASAGIQEPQVSPYPQMSTWALSGRQAQMQMRTMMQVKAFHGLSR